MRTKHWTEDLIRSGLERFYKENGRYPSAREFDKSDYLPTARQIQRTFIGGLPEFREKFKLEGQYNLTTGAVRAAIAKQNIVRSYEYEERFFSYLTTKFPLHLIHEQKRLRPGNISCDFFIFNSEKEGIAIDLFYAMDVWSLARIVNIKLKRYKLLSENQEIYFVSISNPVINQASIDRMMNGRRDKMPKNIKVVTEETLKEGAAKIFMWLDR